VRENRGTLPSDAHEKSFIRAFMRQSHGVTTEVSRSIRQVLTQAAPRDRVAYNLHPIGGWRCRMTFQRGINAIPEFVELVSRTASQ
jgi:hypothetical protein